MTTTSLPTTALLTALERHDVEHAACIAFDHRTCVRVHLVSGLYFSFVTEDFSETDVTLHLPSGAHLSSALLRTTPTPALLAAVAAALLDAEVSE